MPRRKAPTRQRALASTRPTGSRMGLATVAGLGLGGWLLYSIFNKANAATPAGGIPGNAARGAFPFGNPYTVAALDQSVPGVSFAPSSLQPGILTSTLTGVPAVSAQQVAQAGSFWSTLQPTQALSSGYITFPSGSQVAASLMSGGNTAQDGNGNLYVQWAGQVYQLGNQDSAGNYPALPVGGTPAITDTFFPGISPYTTQPVDVENLFTLSGGAWG